MVQRNHDHTKEPAKRPSSGIARMSGQIEPAESQTDSGEGRMTRDSLLPEQGANAIETLRENLIQVLNGNGGSRLIGLTSCYAGEGVTTVTADLGESFGRRDSRAVLVVDANFESPALHNRYRLASVIGLGDIIEGRARPKDIIRSTKVPGVWFLPTGEMHGDLISGYGSPRFAELLQYLRGTYATVLFDTPPLHSDGNPTIRLNRLLDGTLLVVEAEKTRWEVLQHNRDRLTGNNIHVLGAVLNKRRYHVPRWLYRTI